MKIGKTKEVQYFCPTCQKLFYVYHHNDERNTHCCWCNGPVNLTGIVSELVGVSEIHTYQDGKLIARRKKRIINNPNWLQNEEKT